MNGGNGIFKSDYSYNLPVTTKTTNYTATSSDFVILVDSSGGNWTLTLPPAASNLGKYYYIKKTTSDFSTITIDGNASETIDGGTTTTLNTQYEALEIVCNGSNWFINARVIPSVWTSFSMIIQGSVSNPTKGTTSRDEAFWRRVGDSMEISYNFFQTGAGSDGSGVYLFLIPNSLTIDTTKITPDTATGLGAVGTGGGQGGGAISAVKRFGSAIAYSTTQIAIWQIESATGTDLQFLASTNEGISNTKYLIYLNARVPITGWKG